jgi:hypothetical protein
VAEKIQLWHTMGMETTPTTKKQPVFETIAYRGTVFDKKELRRLQRFIDERGNISRAALSRDICTRYAWRRRNGLRPVTSCRALMERLERRQMLKLPALKRQGVKHQRRALSSAMVPLDATHDDLATITQGTTGPIAVRPITKAERQRWHELMARHHYLGDCQMVGEQVSHVAQAGETWVGLVGWASASRHTEVRDQYIGWEAQQRGQGLDLIANNVRFLLLPGAHTPNMASQVLGASLRRLSQDWEAAHGHGIVLAETFVDESRFEGTCYKASNWVRIGESKGWSKKGKTYAFHGEPKAVYVYPLHERWREILHTSKGWRRIRNPVRAPKGIEQSEEVIKDSGGLFAVLGEIGDYRKARGIRFSVQTVLAVAVCAALAGAKSFIEIEEWGEDQTEEVLRRLGCKCGRAPKERTFRRVLTGINASEVDEKVGAWLAQRHGLSGCGVAFDGKTLRGSGHGKRKRPVHLLSAVVQGSGEVVAQVAVDSKTNEITCVKPLFKDLDLRGAVVTADALLTQKEIAKYVVEEKGADYVLTVKDNQPTMKRDIADLHLETFPPAVQDNR